MILMIFLTEFLVCTVTNSQMEILQLPASSYIIFIIILLFSDKHRCRGIVPRMPCFRSQLFEGGLWS